MNYNFKNLIIILVVILTTNIILKNVCIVSFENSLECKIAFKCVLIVMCLFFLNKSNFFNKLKSLRKELPYITISFLLVIYSYFQINSYLVENYSSNSLDNFTFLSSCLSVGVFEELFFRIFIFFFVLKILYNRKNKLLYSILLTSFIFGFSHLSNLFNPEFHKISVVNQVLFAISIGLLLQSLYIKTKSLSVIICLHTLINYFGSYKKHLLFGEIENLESQYTFNDFVTTFISILIFTIIIILPVSYLLIRHELKNNNVA
ncbi:MAG: CPBP family intramembrane glutamic endopeptidase [Weeksellaceae bacterium]